MAATIGKYAAGKFMSKRAKQEQSTRMEDGRDPYWYIETDKHGRTKKKPKKNPSHYPSYIPLEDRERLNKFRTYAKLMDTALFGQVGASFFIGLVPVAGDFADGGISFLLVQRYANSISCGLPKKVYAEMMGNITFDVAIGMIPIIGDIADAVYKANVKNLILLEDYLKKVFAPKMEPMTQVGGPVDGVMQPDRTASKKNNFFSSFGGSGGSKRERDLDQRERELEQRERDMERGGRSPAQPARPDRYDRNDRIDRNDRRDHRDYEQESGTVYDERR